MENLIGKKIKGYKIVSSYQDRVVVAHNDNPQCPEPWVVWYVSRAMEMYSGSYSASFDGAIREYIERIRCHSYA